MKKNKEWLKEQLKHEEVELKYAFDNYEQYEKVLIADDVIDLLNQLEEPEITEEQAWGVIETYNHQHIAPAYVKVYKNYIQQGILPSEIVKQEKVLVPQFVADFIEEVKPNFNIRAVFTLENNKHEQGQEWALDNPDIFARAWFGYEVEKQPKYLVKVNDQGSWLYLKSMSLYKDVERRTDLNSNLIGWKEKGIKFSNKEQAEGIAKFFGGEIEEITK